MTTRCGIWLVAVPPSSVQMDTTAVSSGSMLRETTRLQRHDDVGRCQHRIPGQMRHGRVACMAFQGDLDTGASRHHRAGVNDHRPPPPAPACCGSRNTPFHREPVEQPVRDHRAWPLRTLPRRAGTAGAPSRSNHSPGTVATPPPTGLLVMAVMAAGVHHPRGDGGVGRAGLLRDGQRIHVGPQPDVAVGLSAADRGDDPMTAHPRGVRHAHLGQPGGHEGRRLSLVQRQLGVGMEVAAPAGQGRRQGRGRMSRSCCQHPAVRALRPAPDVGCSRTGTRLLPGV